MEFLGRFPVSCAGRVARSGVSVSYTLRGHVPDAIIDQRGKGFGIRLFEWFGAELRD